MSINNELLAVYYELFIDINGYEMKKKFSYEDLVEQTFIQWTSFFLINRIRITIIDPHFI